MIPKGKNFIGIIKLHKSVSIKILRYLVATKTGISSITVPRKYGSMTLGAKALKSFCR